MSTAHRETDRDRARTIKREREVPGETVATVMTVIASVLAQLEGLRARLPENGQVHQRLSEVTFELEAIGRDVLSPPKPEPSHRRLGRG